MKRSLPPALLLVMSLLFSTSAVVVAVAAPAALSACNSNQRQDTLKAALVGLNAARDGFTAWDATHRKALIDAAKTREEGEAALAAYKAKRAPIVDTFEVAYRTLAVAATQTDDPSLSAALAASGALLDAIKKLTAEGGS